MGNLQYENLTLEQTGTSVARPQLRRRKIRLTLIRLNEEKNRKIRLFDMGHRLDLCPSSLERCTSSIRQKSLQPS